MTASNFELHSETSSKICRDNDRRKNVRNVVKIRVVRKLAYLFNSLAASVATEAFLACALAMACLCRAASSSAQRGFVGTLPTRLVKTLIL